MPSLSPTANPSAGRLTAGLLLFLSSMAFPGTALGQQAVDYGSVSGRVTDPSSAVVPGAEVTIRHPETNAIETALTNREGRFRFPYLKIGPAELSVRLRGFAEATRRLTLSPGSAFDLSIQLRVETSETVTVSGEATALEAARSQIAGTVSRAEVESLPLNGRNFLDLALLVPGVSPTNAGGTQLFPETSAVAGPGLSISSQRNLSNNFIVDGLSANDDAAGLSGIPYGIDAVEEFQVVTSGGQAELGRALGGYVNVVTKSGTNTSRGDLYGYFRDESLNSPSPLTGEKLPMSQGQFGVSHGGPIVRDRTFYFVNVERKNLEQDGLVTISPTHVEAINARLKAVGYPGAPIGTGLYPATVAITHGLFKVDHEFSPRDRFTLRYGLYDLRASNSRNVGGLSATTAAAGLDNTDHSIALGNVAILSPQTVLESRAQFAYGDLQAPPADPVGPAVSIAGVAVFGTSSGNPTARLNTMYQVVNNLSHHAGTHAWRAGVDFLYNDSRVTFPRAVRGSYTFSSLANFLNGTYNNSGFSQTFGTSTVDLGNPNLGVYVQDEWKVTPRLTLNTGLRYDLQFLDQIDLDKDNVAPRLGFVWSPSAESLTLVRGSAGLFYDRVPLRPLANAILSAGNTRDVSRIAQIGLTLSPNQTGAPVFPGILSQAVASTRLVNISTMNRRMKNAHSRQVSLEIERQMGVKATASVGYTYVKGLDLIMSINQNVPSCVAAGENNGCRPHPEYANNNEYSPAGTSTYHGLQVAFLLRPTAWGSYRLSYTLSKSMNNVGEAFFNGPIDPFDLAKDWGRSDDDQRHRLVMSGTVNTSRNPGQTAWEKLTHGFQLSAMLRYYSALPFNITSGVTTIQGTAGRPIVNGEFIARNAGTGSDFFSLSARLSRTFKVSDRIQLEAIAEGFNLTNRRNDLTRNTNFGPGAYPTNPSASFNQITAVDEPRGFQFGLRLQF